MRKTFLINHSRYEMEIVWYSKKESIPEFGPVC